MIELSWHLDSCTTLRKAPIPATPPHESVPHSAARWPWWCKWQWASSAKSQWSPTWRIALGSELTEKAQHLKRLLGLFFKKKGVCFGVLFALYPQYGLGNLKAKLGKVYPGARQGKLLKNTEIRFGKQIMLQEDWIKGPQLWHIFFARQSKVQCFHAAWAFLFSDLLGLQRKSNELRPSLSVFSRKIFGPMMYVISIYIYILFIYNVRCVFMLYNMELLLLHLTLFFRSWPYSRLYAFARGVLRLLLASCGSQCGPANPRI